MVDLSASYLGLRLKNPLVVGSCGYTSDLDGVKACAAAGAGAVVLKSIFEEQIRADFADLSAGLAEGTYHPEAYDYFRADLASRYGAHDYCERLSAMRAAVDLPIIASINCYSDSAWRTFALEIERAGASALELNVSFPPLALFERDPAEHVRELAELVGKLTAKLKIPLTVKLPPAGMYTFALAQALVKAGAKGLVAFNRFLVPGVDVSGQVATPAVNFSSPGEAGQTRRYVALLAKRLPADLAAAGGVQSGEELIGMLLVGAQVAQVVSAIYLHGLPRLSEMLARLTGWMQEQGYERLDDFRGRLAAAPGETQNPFGRFQYIQTLGEITGSKAPI